MVSIRGDKQGVLSLQFMIEWEGGADGGMGATGKGPSFVEFRILPVGEGGSESEEGEGGGYEEGGQGERGGNDVGDWVV